MHVDGDGLPIDAVRTHGIVASDEIAGRYFHLRTGSEQNLILVTKVRAASSESEHRGGWIVGFEYEQIDPTAMIGLPLVFGISERDVRTETRGQGPPRDERRRLRRHPRVKQALSMRKDLPDRIDFKGHGIQVAGRQRFLIIRDVAGGGRRHRLSPRLVLGALAKLVVDVVAKSLVRTLVGYVYTCVHRAADGGLEPCSNPIRPSILQTLFERRCPCVP